MRRPSTRELAAAFNAFAPPGYQFPDFGKPPADAPLLDPLAKVQDQRTTSDDDTAGTR